MSFIKSIPVIGDLIDSIGKGLDELFTSDEEQGKIDIEKKRIELKRLALELKAQHAQLEINLVQANHPSLFVAGARPAIIWIGAVGLAYEAILRPILNGIWTAFYKPDYKEILKEAVEKFGQTVTSQQIQTVFDSYAVVFPSIQTELFMPIVLGVLGIGGMRSWEKIQGKARNNLGAASSTLELEKVLNERLNQTNQEINGLENQSSESSSQQNDSTGNASVDEFKKASNKSGFTPKKVSFDELFDEGEGD